MHSTTIDDPRLLHERFLRARRAVGGAVAVVSHNTLLVNGPAAALTRAADRSLLWEWARRDVAYRVADGPQPPPVVLASGARPHLCEGIRIGPALVGAVVRLAVPDAVRPPRAAGPDRGRHAQWAELTTSQRRVAEHVAGGLTNRETAVLLSVSPHTVDYHLRHVFRKFRIRSRVELARLVAEAAFSRTPPPG
ncbi:helix-turn-helix transcriptional regulator [Streptomyces sp. NPDC002755]